MSWRGSRVDRRVLLRCRQIPPAAGRIPLKTAKNRPTPQKKAAILKAVKAGKGSAPEIAQAVGATAPAVRVALRELLKAGAVKKEAKRGPYSLP
jgi:hypothetical protein